MINYLTPMETFGKWRWITKTFEKSSLQITYPQCILRWTQECFSRADIDIYRKQHSDKSLFATVLKYAKAKELGNFSVDKHKQALIFSGLKMNVMNSPSTGNMSLIIMHLKTSSKYSQCSVYKVSSVMKSFIRYVPHFEIPTPNHVSHFVCQNNYCAQCCNASHEIGHCHGFREVSHVSKYHCKPISKPLNMHS